MDRFLIKAMYLIAILLLFPIGANIENHFKKIENKEQISQIDGIDFIYLINLEHRKEKLHNSLNQLHPYGIYPYCFSAVNGWQLSIQAINEVGLKYVEGMQQGKYVVLRYFLHAEEQPFFKRTKLTEELYDKTIFSSKMNPGAIGCTLSHLSILQDAYDSGYETIWVMEDDIIVNEDPHMLTQIIDKLDSLVGKDNWDVLYTSSHYSTNRKDKQANLAWRPDNTFVNYDFFLTRKKIDNNFIKIGSRSLTTSMVIRRSGMKKILDYEKKHQIFIPYDHEIALPPGINLYMLAFPLTNEDNSISDIRLHNPYIDTGKFSTNFLNE